MSRILIVEDDLLIGLMLTDMFEALNLPAPAHAANMAEALDMIGSEMFSGALIDVNLAGEKGWPIAEELTKRNIAFAFTTGGGDDIPLQFRDAPIVMKPFRINDIEAVVGSFV